MAISRNQFKVTHLLLLSEITSTDGFANCSRIILPIQKSSCPVGIARSSRKFLHASATALTRFLNRMIQRANPRVVLGRTKLNTPEQPPREQEGENPMTARNVAKIVCTLALFLCPLVEPTTLIAADAPWQAEWEKTVKAAEQEGEVIYSASGSYRFLEEFHKAFPKIRTTVVSASCNQIVSRIMTERRGGKYLADVVRCGMTSAHSLYRAKTLQSVGPALVLPEVTDLTKWWQGKHHYSDPEGKYLFISAASVYVRFASYNKDLVNPAELKSFWDLLSPRWKGKIVATDPRTGEGRNGSRFLYYNPELGPPYLRRLLSETGLKLSRDYRQATDWLAQKQYALFLFSQSDDTLTASQQGLPVQVLDTTGWKEGVGLDPIAGAYALMDKPAHPNAAKVLLNWLLSREGQLAVQRDPELAGRTDSLRNDIPKTDVHPMMRRRDGVKYHIMWNPDWMDMKPVEKVVNQALEEAQKK
jgi:iron(III) transport system substrate-binding protein